MSIPHPNGGVYYDYFDANHDKTWRVPYSTSYESGAKQLPWLDFIFIMKFIVSLSQSLQQHLG